MARNGLVFALVAAVAVICFLAFSGQQQVASPVARAAGGIARPVFVRGEHFSTRFPIGGSVTSCLDDALLGVLLSCLIPVLTCSHPLGLLVCAAANNIKMPQSALGSWGDAIKKNALGAGVVPNKKPITKKAW